MKPYNPLDKKNIAESIVNRLLDKNNPITPLEALSSFKGSGVYVIYYAGDFKPYADYRNDASNGVFDRPIYIGKTGSNGARKGKGFEEEAIGNKLYTRLAKHRQSLRDAANLESHDFYFRHLVVDDVWIPLAEWLLISKFSPIWNVAIDGFGIHDPGKGRDKQERSKWDTVHPGRPVMMKLPERKQSAEEILASLPKLIRRDEVVES